MLKYKNDKSSKKFYNLLFKICSVFVLCMIISGTVFYNNLKTADTVLVTSESFIEKPTVIIDAGHGGFDGGAVAKDGTLEKDINLLIAKSTEKVLLFSGFNVIMTRDEDTSTNTKDYNKIALNKKSDMQNRLDLMNKNKSAVYLGIHLNKYTTSAATGAQVFYGVQNEKSYTLAKEMQNAFKNILQNENNRVVKKATKSTYLLYNALNPAIITECGFLSNQTELNNLKSEEYRNKISMVIGKGLINGLNA